MQLSNVCLYKNKYTYIQTQVYAIELIMQIKAQQQQTTKQGMQHFKATKASKQVQRYLLTNIEQQKNGKNKNKCNA